MKLDGIVNGTRVLGPSTPPHIFAPASGVYKFTACIFPPCPFGRFVGAQEGEVHSNAVGWGPGAETFPLAAVTLPT